MKVSSHTQFQKIATKVLFFSELRKDFRKKAYKSQNNLRMWDFFRNFAAEELGGAFRVLGNAVDNNSFFHTD